LIQNPFTFETKKATGISLPELTCSQKRSIQILECNLTNVSGSKFPNINELAAKLSTVFGSTHIYEQTISRMKFVTSKFCPE
jgi:hypothetical protein